MCVCLATVGTHANPGTIKMERIPSHALAASPSL